MTRVYFKRRFHEAVRSGRKTSTLRRWAKPRVVAGQTIFSPGIGKLTVIECRQIMLDSLTRADARADGFPSVEHLLETIARIYPDHKTDGKSWFRLIFQRVDPPEPNLFTALPSMPAKGHRHENSSPTRKKVKRMAPRRASAVGVDFRSRLAAAVREELDKAVQRKGSLAVL